MATKQTEMRQVLNTFGDQPAPFGGIEAIWELSVYKSDSGDIVVQLGKDGYPFAEKRFIYCETQHSDSERWLNDQVRYPNPFAGILLHQEWDIC